MDRKEQGIQLRIIFAAVFAIGVFIVALNKNTNFAMNFWIPWVISLFMALSAMSRAHKNIPVNAVFVVMIALSYITMIAVALLLALSDFA